MVQTLRAECESEVDETVLFHDELELRGIYPRVPAI